MVEPITWLFFGVLLASAAVLVFWEQVLFFLRLSVQPWIDFHLPFLSPFVPEALARLDKAVTSLRSTIKAAWQKLRHWLLKSLVEFSRKTSSVWLKRVTSFLIKILENGQKQPVKVTTEEEQAWDDLPDDVREAMLRTDRNSYQENITARRDQELENVQ